MTKKNFFIMCTMVAVGFTATLAMAEVVVKSSPPQPVIIEKAKATPKSPVAPALTQPAEITGIPERRAPHSILELSAPPKVSVDTKKGLVMPAFKQP